MLPDFPVALNYGGERHKVECRDVATAVFFHGFPNALPMTPCYDGSSEAQQWAYMHRLRAWMLELLPRVAVNPVLTPELVHRLDDGALDLNVGYLHAVGWISDEDLEKQAARSDAMGDAARRYLQTLGALADEYLPVVTPAPRLYGREHRPFVGAMAPNIKLAIREVAVRAHVRPSTLWQAPISEFLLDFQLLIREAPRSDGIHPDDAAIGFESYGH